MKCNFGSCTKLSRTKKQGLCAGHYSQKQRGRPLTPLRVRDNSGYTHKHSGYRWVFRNGKKILEHRWILEQHIGRPLTQCENVHHINGVRRDNRIDNLELWNIGQPKGQRVEDKLEWARNLLHEYAPVGSFDEEEIW